MADSDNDFSDLANDIKAEAPPNTNDFSDLSSDIKLQDKAPTQTKAQTALTGATTGLQTFAQLPLQWNKSIVDAFNKKFNMQPSSSGILSALSSSMDPVSASDIESAKQSNPVTYGLSNLGGSLISAAPSAFVNPLDALPSLAGKFAGPISQGAKYLGNAALQGLAGTQLSNPNASIGDLGAGAAVNAALSPIGALGSAAVTGVAPRLLKSLFGSVDAAKSEYKNLYKSLFKDADSSGLTINPKNSFDEAQNQLDLIKKNNLKSDQEYLNPAKDVLNNFMSDVTDPDFENGLTLQVMKNKSKTLGDAAYELSKGSKFDRASAAHIMPVKDALDQDIYKSAQENGQPGLFDRLKTADKTYATKYLPFEQNPLLPSWKDVGQHPQMIFSQPPAALMARMASKLNGGPMSVFNGANNPFIRSLALQQTNSNLR